MQDAASEDSTGLLQLISSAKSDYALLIWAAGALNACLLKEAPLSSYESAMQEFGIFECKKYLPAAWVARDKMYAPCPPSAALVIVERLEELDSSGSNQLHQEAMEASAWLLASLLELVRSQQRNDKSTVREKLLIESGRIPCFLKTLLSVMTARAEDSDDITTSRDVAFLNACLMLAFLADGDQTLSLSLQLAGVPEIVSARISQKASLTAATLWQRKLPLRWEAFATATSQLLEVLLAASPTTTKLDMQSGALLTILNKSFTNRGACALPFASTVVQAMHVSCFKALYYIVRVAPVEALCMRRQKAHVMAAQVLKIEGAHEEAILLIFEFLFLLMQKSPQPQADASEADLIIAVKRILERCKKYPLGTVTTQAAGLKLLEFISASRK